MVSPFSVAATLGFALIFVTPAGAQNALTAAGPAGDSAAVSIRPQNYRDTTPDYVLAGNTITVHIPAWSIPHPESAQVYATTSCTNGSSDRLPDTGTLPLTSQLAASDPADTASAPCDLVAFRMSRMADGNFEVDWELAAAAATSDDGGNVRAIVNDGTTEVTVLSWNRSTTVPHFALMYGRSTGNPVSVPGWADLTSLGVSEAAGGKLQWTLLARTPLPTTTTPEDVSYEVMVSSSATGTIFLDFKVRWNGSSWATTRPDVSVAVSGNAMTITLPLPGSAAGKTCDYSVISALALPGVAAPLESQVDTLPDRTRTTNLSATFGTSSYPLIHVSSSNLTLSEPKNAPASSSFVVSNTGTASAHIALLSDGTFFSTAPAQFDLAPGASQTAVVTAPGASTGTYRGNIFLSGWGVSTEPKVSVFMTAGNPPSPSRHHSVRR